MRRVLRSDAARIDLAEIWEFVADVDPAAADRLLRALAEGFERIARHPMMGRRRDEVLPGLRSHTIGRHVVFYRPLADGIAIIRVLHGARDVGRAFSDPA